MVYISVMLAQFKASQSGKALLQRILGSNFNMLQFEIEEQRVMNCQAAHDPQISQY